MRRLVIRLLRSPFAAGLVSASLAVFLVVGVVALQGSDDLPEAPSASVDIVHDFAVAVTSLDYRRIDQDVARVLAFAAKSFERDLTAVIDEGFVDQAVTAKRISVGEVVAGPTVQGLGDERATLLVVVNQRVVSEGSEEPPQIVRVTMLVTVETDDKPLVTGVRVL